ncbi:hypothetical protein [Aquimonas voraii]|uniref:Uncharacterized protein n=1 Tax=Aquimonas voraii TaxID=265719 RepID=A0A1G6T0V8_9GAMM|nr:hypothetical protein [Aquimonas voraii]SDD22790.1 hypothetical protein SAMN04488509_101823 [Aquimonas voraii]
MALVDRIADLAIRIGRVLASKIDATHPGVARAWVCFGAIDGEVVIRAAHQVLAVDRTAPGRYRIHFAVRLPDTHYCWTALARSSVDRGQQRFAVVRAKDDLKTARFVDVSCATAASTFTDSTEINVVVYR